MSLAADNRQSSIVNRQSYDAVLLIAFGGPTKFDEVRPFLENVLRGHPVPPERVEEVVHHYEVIGGASPLNALTIKQAKALEALLKETGPSLPVYVGMRNWRPFIQDVLEAMAAQGMKKVLGFILSAHRSEASIARYTTRVEEARLALGDRAPEIEYVGPWFDHPLFIEAVADYIRETLRLLPEEHQRRAAWIFTAHSIPMAMAEASTYVQDLTASAERVAALLGHAQWSVAYQSRSGNPRDPWLEPDVLDVIEEQAKKGVKDVVLIPIGFVCDHVEVLYDLDVEAKEKARQLGVECWRVPTVGTHPKFIAMMASMVRRATGS